MNTVHFLQKARHALVPMRKATMDAFLLGTIIIILLTYAGTGILFTYTWLIVPIYALVYLIAVVLRLRKAAYAAEASSNPEQPVDEASQELSSIETLNEAGLFKGDLHHYPFP